MIIPLTVVDYIMYSSILLLGMGMAFVFYRLVGRFIVKMKIGGEPDTRYIYIALITISFIWILFFAMILVYG